MLSSRPASALLAFSHGAGTELCFPTVFGMPAAVLSHTWAVPGLVLWHLCLWSCTVLQNKGGRSTSCRPLGKSSPCRSSWGGLRAAVQELGCSWLLSPLAEAEMLFQVPVRLCLLRCFWGWLRGSQQELGDLSGACCCLRDRGEQRWGGGRARGIFGENCTELHRCDLVLA